MLNHVVTSVKQYAAGALVPGYFVGGKTGTAEIWDPKIGDWKDNTYNFSFVGYIGRQTGRPDLVVALRLQEVQPIVLRAGSYQMPLKSWELFGRIATDAVQIPGLLPDLPADSSPAQPADR
jgi:cell division protein FtsI/penicillin-binding protein 2